MKVFLQRILQEIMKKIILGTSDAWSTIHLSHRPSDWAWIYLRLTNFKCCWWLSWKETNLFLVVYSPLFQCSLQGCWTGIQFLEFINHSQKWPPHGSIYSAFCKVFIMSPEFDSKHFRLMAQLHWLQKWPWFFFSDLLNGQK